MNAKINKEYPGLVGNSVLFNGDVCVIIKAYDYEGDDSLIYILKMEDGSTIEVDSWDCTDLTDCISRGGLDDLAYIMGENVDTMEDIVYDMGYSVF